MTCSRLLPLLLVAGLLPFVDVLFAAPQAQKPRKVAFLVGVGDFKHDLRSLGDSPKKDVAALAEELKGGGFEVVVLTDAGATKKEIEARFKAVLDGGGKAAALGKKDMLLVAVCSHGFTMEVTAADGKKMSEPFLAAHDTRLGDVNSMVSLNGLIDGSKSFAPTTLFLVDACREVNDPNRGPRGIEGKQIVLPNRTAVLFACGQGQLSYQSEKAGGHGLFTFAVLKTLRDGGGGHWDRMVSGVKEAFETDEIKKMMPPGASQSPVLATGELGYTALLTKKADGGISAKGAEPRPGEVRRFAVADGVQMEFCWIPPGADGQLGSSKAEQDYITKTIVGEKNLSVRLDYESETYRETFNPPKGFWLGKYEVTQDEWVKAGDGPNLSTHVPTDKDMAAAGIKDTSRFPVENVSWIKIRGKDGKGGGDTFLGKLNTRPGAKTAFGKAGEFVLPHEDEWEYACRGGRGNKRAFYWGSELNGTQANCDGKKPFWTETAGPYLGRTCAVDFDNDGKYPKHPWGLCHMHGNVWEWCETKSKDTADFRVIRGGSLYLDAWSCRSAVRNRFPAGAHTYELGFRVMYRLN